MKSFRAQWRSRRPAEANAARELARATEHYFRVGSKAVEADSSEEQLHKFRLATKHFRYLLELFDKMYGKPAEPYVKKLKHIQTLLGDLNDFATTRTMVRDEAGPEVKRLLEYLDSQQQKKLKEFQRYWKTHFKDNALEDWTKFLSAPPPVV